MAIYEVTIEFETKDGEPDLTPRQESDLHSWIIGTFENASYEKCVGFPASRLEHHAAITGFSKE